MVKLAPSQIKTKEVLDWKGLHLLHAGMSSCSQKTRIFLNLKGLDWEGHYIDLASDANHQPWFLGINPRGLVPVLVHDGEVHIESNDILLYAETLADETRLIPDKSSKQVKHFLDLEDNLHMDLRALTFRYVIPSHGPKLKDPEALERYKAASEKVDGKFDPHIQEQIDFWEAANENGITDEQVKTATANFKRVFTEIDKALAQNDFVLGDQLTAVDIAWFIYSNRLRLAGYPLSIHTHLDAWFARLKSMDAFAKEIALPPPFEVAMKANQAKLAAKGDTLVKVTQIAA